MTDYNPIPERFRLPNLIGRMFHHTPTANPTPQPSDNGLGQYSLPNVLRRAFHRDTNPGDTSHGGAYGGSFFDSGASHNGSGGQMPGQDVFGGYGNGSMFGGSDPFGYQGGQGPFAVGSSGPLNGSVGGIDTGPFSTRPITDVHTQQGGGSYTPAPVTGGGGQWNGTLGGGSTLNPSAWGGLFGSSPGNSVPFYSQYATAAHEGGGFGSNFTLGAKTTGGGLPPQQGG